MTIFSNISAKVQFSCISIIIGSDNILSLAKCQVIICNNVGLFFTGPLGMNLDCYEYTIIHLRICIWKWHLQNDSHFVQASMLTHCRPVKQWGEIDLGQHCFRQWFVAWWHQTITRNNADLSSKVFSCIQQGEISNEMCMNSIHNLCCEITPSKSLSHLPGANELSNNPGQLIIGIPMQT